MRPWMVLLLALVSAPAFSMGKLTLKPQQDLENGDLKYSLGLSVDEKIAGPLYYVGWFGGGADEADGMKNWLKTEQGLAMRVGHAAIGAGVSYTGATRNDWDSLKAYVEASLKLW